ncbi:MAG: efflux RND transporter periplasmic adaptor subunit [Bacteroidetes bacterium]|nr:efflux RND transporter periplasmic adaptor subunit [Bacteroidota bacterium]
MIKQLIFLIFSVSVVAGISSCHSGSSGTNNTGKQGSAKLFVDGYIVKPTTLDQTITISGTIIPFEETVLMPDVSGRVVYINLPEGKFAKKGTVLVKLFDGDLQSSLKKLQTQLKIAEQTRKRQSELLKVNGLSQLEYDQTDLQVNSILDDIEVMKVQISKTEVVAPFDGIIGLRNVSVGAQVNSSIALATIRMVDRLKLDFSVPEKYSEEIREGRSVSFTVQGDETKYEAKVMASEEGIESQTRNLKVRAIVSSKNPALKPGAFANVELALSENKNALMIPTQAIIPQERDKKVIVSKGGKARFVAVKTGIRQVSKVQVLEGINVGDTIVVSGLLFIKPKADLKFSKFIK